MGLAVLREGSELVLFLYGIAAQGSQSLPVQWTAPLPDDLLALLDALEHDN